MTPAEKITKARANLVMGHPFFGTLALRMKCVADDTIDTACTDGNTLRYSPKFVNKLSLAKVQGLLAHEVMHPALLHHTRRGPREHRKWNIACDYSINTMLLAAGFELPEGRYENAAYRGMSAEHIYTLLPDESDPGGGTGNTGDPQGDGGKNSNDSGGGDPGGDGGVDDSPSSTNQGGSQSQQNSEEAEWKQALAQAAHVAKQAGKLPGDLEKLLSSVLEPVLPWKDILRRFMTEKSMDDFSWKRGNRRFVAQGLYLPSRVSDDAMGDMVVVIDTSGSIQQRQLDEFGAEITAIHAEVRPTRLHVIYCDARVNGVDSFTADETPRFTLRGGGGTDFRPPFVWLEENNIRPRAFVYLTDGYGAFPEEEPAFPTLWCINNDAVVPPFGEHLILETI